jgi:hypothetical protein
MRIHWAVALLFAFGLRADVLVVAATASRVFGLYHPNALP